MKFGGAIVTQNLMITDFMFESYLFRSIHEHSLFSLNPNFSSTFLQTHGHTNHRGREREGGERDRESEREKERESSTHTKTKKHTLKQKHTDRNAHQDRHTNVLLRSIINTCTHKCMCKHTVINTGICTGTQP